MVTSLTLLTLARRAAWAALAHAATLIIRILDYHAPEPADTGHTAEPVDVWERG
jgi:hypothetical protein